MREIKFRAFIKKTGQMLDVIEISWYSKNVRCVEGGVNLNHSTGQCEHDWDFPLYNFDEIELVEFTDRKDKNCKEIYKGSKIRYLSLGSVFTGKIIWCEANLTWVVEAVDGDGLHQRLFLAHIKNPELMA